MTTTQVVALLVSSGVLGVVANVLLIGPRRHRTKHGADTAQVLGAATEVIGKAASDLVKSMQSQLERSHVALDAANHELRAARLELEASRAERDRQRDEILAVHRELQQLRAISGQRSREVATLVEGVRLLLEQLVGLGVDPVWHLPLRFTDRPYQATDPEDPPT